MKKIILSLLIIASVNFAQAQKANVSKAKNKALSETPDFSGARELIQPALVDESTKDLANTWYVAGLIGYKQNEGMEKAVLLGKAVDPDTKGKAVLESYDYLLVADSLDRLPNAKGNVKQKFKKEIQKMITEYYTFSLVNYGAHLFEKKEYNEALNVFNTFLKTPDLPLIEGTIQKDSTYTMIKYYSAIAASYGGKNDKAIELFEELKEENYETLAVYQLLYEEYVNKKDTANFVKVLEEGSAKFPKESWFLQNLINLYIYSGQSEKALNFLDKAIQQEPDFAQYSFVQGTLFESLGRIDEAVASYNKAIQIDPQMSTAYAELGRVHYNKAVAILDAADALKDRKSITAEQKKANDEFAAAVPFYEKALSLKPDENSYKVMLRQLYYRLKMDAKYEAINKEIEGD